MTGNLDMNGSNITKAALLLSGNGSLSNPTYSFDQFSSSGMFMYDFNTVGFAAGTQLKAIMGPAGCTFENVNSNASLSVGSTAYIGRSLSVGTSLSVGSTASVGTSLAVGTDININNGGNNGTITFGNTGHFIKRPITTNNMAVGTTNGEIQLETLDLNVSLPGGDIISKPRQIERFRVGETGVYVNYGGNTGGFFLGDVGNGMEKAGTNTILKSTNDIYMDVTGSGAIVCRPQSIERARIDQDGILINKNGNSGGVYFGDNTYGIDRTLTNLVTMRSNGPLSLRSNINGIDMRVDDNQILVLDKYSVTVNTNGSTGGIYFGVSGGYLERQPGNNMRLGTNNADVIIDSIGNGGLICRPAETERFRTNTTGTFLNFEQTSGNLFYSDTDHLLERPNGTNDMRLGASGGNVYIDTMGVSGGSIIFRPRSTESTRIGSTGVFVNFGGNGGGYYFGSEGHYLRRQVGTNNLDLFTTAGNITLKNTGAGSNIIAGLGGTGYFGVRTIDDSWLAFRAYSEGAMGADNNVVAYAARLQPENGGRMILPSGGTGATGLSSEITTGSTGGIVTPYLSNGSTWKQIITSDYNPVSTYTNANMRINTAVISMYANGSSVTYTFVRGSNLTLGSTGYTNDYAFGINYVTQPTTIYSWNISVASDNGAEALTGVFSGITGPYLATDNKVRAFLGSTPPVFSTLATATYDFAITIMSD